MTLDVKKYVRRPFAVEAVQVTPDNIKEVARWCGGRIKRTSTSHWTARAGQEYVKVRVNKPLNERQTMAYYGDWVLSAEDGSNGFKVYTPKAFAMSFQEEVDHMVEVVGRMQAREAAEEQVEQEEMLEFSDVTQTNH